MAYNTVITSDDPQAVLKLEENIKSYEERNEYMQSVNDYYTDNGTMSGFPGMDDETAARLDERVGENQKTPYPGRFFKENFTEIHRLKSSIEQLKNNRNGVFKGWNFNEGKAVVNLANNRLQLVFNDKPSDEQRNALKQNGFKWAPSFKAWQRQLNDKAFSAADRIEFIKPLDGQKPTEMQPKQLKYNAPER